MTKPVVIGPGGVHHVAGEPIRRAMTNPVVIGPGGVHHVAGEPIRRAMTNPVVIGPGGVHHVAGELPEAEQQHCGALGLNQSGEL
jgi:hypothetical protein